MANGDTPLEDDVKLMVLEARPDRTCLVELVLAPQTADADGDFVQAVLTEGEHEVIRA